MKKYLTKTSILIGGGVGFMILLMVFLFFDAFYGGNNFRTMQDPIPSSQKVDLTGLREIQASGGNAPRFSDLQRRLSHITKDKIIVDVKCEYHGYIKGVPTTFLGYTVSPIGLRHTLRRFFLTGTTEERPDLVISESDEAKKYGFQYASFTIGNRFTATDDNIDDIVTFFDTLPKDVWLHIHCTNGKGRTSTILAMLDMMKNAPKVALSDIVKRHQLLGSVNLFDIKVWKNGTYDKEQLENRKNFIIAFYKFISDRKAGGPQKWSDWHRQQPEGAVPTTVSVSSVQQR